MRHLPKANLLYRFTVAALVLEPRSVLAGMPSPLPDDMSTVLRLAEHSTERLQVISFFLLGLLLSAGAVQLLWNGLRREFPKFPRLTYLKAFGITVAWGLMFCIVLVMISGARELMTPGAWKKNGATYELNVEAAGSAEPSEP